MAEKPFDLIIYTGIKLLKISGYFSNYKNMYTRHSFSKNWNWAASIMSTTRSFNQNYMLDFIAEYLKFCFNCWKNWKMYFKQFLSIEPNIKLRLTERVIQNLEYMTTNNKCLEILSLRKRSLNPISQYICFNYRSEKSKAYNGSESPSTATNATRYESNIP